MSTSKSLDHEELLRSHKHEVAAKLQSMPQVLNMLEGRRAINSVDKRSFSKIQDSYKQATALVEHLQVKPKKAFLVFIQVLEETEQEHLVDMLLPGGI